NFKHYAPESDRDTNTSAESDHSTITSTDEVITPRSLSAESDQEMIALSIKRSHSDRKNHDLNNSDSNSARARKKMRAIGLYNGVIKQILALGIDDDTLIASIEALEADGWGPGAIADELRDNPPPKGQPYERRHTGPVQPEPQTHQRQRSPGGS